MMKPFFSIIMPVYNGEQYLSVAIDSVLSQTFNDWELIIVDDGSTDSSVSIVESYDDLRIRLLKIQHSGSANSARKHAYAEANGEFFQLLDCDDYLSSNFLMEHYQRIKSTGADCVLCDMHYVDNSGKILKIWTIPKNDYSLILNGKDAFFYSLDWRIHGVFCTRAELVKKNYDDIHLMNGDELFSRVLFSRCNNVAFDEGIYYYRNNANSTTLSKTNRIHQYETLFTSYSLLDFAKQTFFEDYILQKAQGMFLGSLILFQQKYFLEKNEFDKNLKKEIKDILISSFNKLNSITAKRLDKKLKLFFLITHKNYYIFSFVCYCLLLLKNKKKGRLL